MAVPGDHTIREILSQPQVWKECLAALERSGELRELNERLPREIEFAFIGCGSSYYLAQVAAATWADWTGGNARAIPASEVLLFPKVLPKPCQPVLISRSGRTSEVLDAANYLERTLRVPSLAITCGLNTPLEEASAHTVKLPQADEKSTVMTRSFTSMLLALQMLAAHRSGHREFGVALKSLPRLAEPLLPSIQETIRSLADANAFADSVFLGQGPFHGVAQEATLKVTEMSCSYAQCFHTLEFRHGPKAIVSPETLIVFFISERGKDAESAVLGEMKELGGKILAVCNSASPAIRGSADYFIELSLDAPEEARAAVAVVCGQLLGFHTGMRKGFNPDEPRNLTRVVMLNGGEGGPPSVPA